VEEKSMADDEVIGLGEFRSTAAPRVAVISGNRFKNLGVHYSAIDGSAVFEGDIILGTLEGVATARQAAVAGIETLGSVIKGHRWPGRRIPYQIQPDLPNPERVTEAIAHWQQKTTLTFARRTSEKDYVVFRPSDGCSSYVGMQGGVQYVNLAPYCTTGNAIHEVGHTIGLWHEQSRIDRDSHVTIAWDNIIPNLEHNFLQHVTDGDDVGEYDFGSIMHYPANAFAKDPNKPTIIVKSGVTIGQRIALSDGDIAAVGTIYKNAGL
jgi:hypothetical protein